MSVSVIIPCLNEEGSIEECIRLVKAAFAGEGKLEIIVADNGSTDRSSELAKKAGARVVEERRQGYGSAILCGIREATGEFLVIGDADNTYDFRDAAILVEKLKEGAEFAIGDRIHGEVDKGAMPWLHMHLGTPVLTWVLNQFFGCRVHDINCGLRAIRREAVERLRLRSPGMEFASEMVIHAQKAGLKFAETPIRYYRRHHGQAKLRTFRDGWRHLRFILLCAPFPLYFLPAAASAILSAYFYTQPRLGFLVLASLFSLAAFQFFIFGVLAKTYLWVADSFLVDRGFGSLIDKFKLEYGILTSLLFLLGGIVLVREFDISNLIRGASLIALSLQIFFSSFLLSTIMFKKRDTI
ncbi:MAG: glycosyltransferase family 2 protein [Deltaproteobacteria bacterium]|nr:glycosyltransferase family 2 protein [Deltaproteobacteria bacterium]